MERMTIWPFCLRFLPSVAGNEIVFDPGDLLKSVGVLRPAAQL
jgi:hypothetical protein